MSNGSFIARDPELDADIAVEEIHRHSRRPTSVNAEARETLRRVTRKERYSKDHCGAEAGEEGQRADDGNSGRIYEEMHQPCCEISFRGENRGRGADPNEGRDNNEW